MEGLRISRKSDLGTGAQPFLEVVAFGLKDQLQNLMFFRAWHFLQILGVSKS